MKYYHSYMDRQEISPAVHEKLLNLEGRKRPSKDMWVQLAALAACCALLVGLWHLEYWFHPSGVYEGESLAATGPIPPEVPDTGAAPPLAADSGTVILGDWDSGFVVNSPVDEGTYGFFCMPAIAFPDRTESSDMALSRVYAPGSFTVDLTMEDIQTLFWGAEGIPETYQTEIGRQDLPWALFWDGYFVHGSAWYDGQGRLMELTLYGEKDRAGFELELRQGELPFSCAVDLDRGDEISEFNGVEITGWSKVYDRDGDGQTDYICGSEFMTKDDTGVRFTSWNNGSAEDGVDGEAWFNTLFIRQVLTGGLYLDRLETNEAVPAWREEELSTLAQARQETDFAPYLPTKEPEGYSSYAGNKEFHSYLSYQEGARNTLFVRWSRGYDNVEVAVYRDGYRSCNLVDPAKPETYDLRLYEIPWCDSVPEEYWDTVNRPTIRAEDMSLAIVEARGREHDTGGMTYSFDVLHPDGTVVSYHCDGLTAQQVWAMVEETLD